MICTSHWPKVFRSLSRQHYSGSTATNGLGPVVLPDVASLWHVLWPIKKEMYGKDGILPVGGKVAGEDEDSDAAEDKAPPAPRNAGTSEPVAWHSMPQLFWQEILFDFKVGAVIDLTPADGTLAMTALHARIPYTGLTFTPKHATELLGRLQSLVLAAEPPRGRHVVRPAPRGSSHEADGESQAPCKDGS